MQTIETLTEYFSKFPGIGPKQAKRFVYYLLRRDSQTLENLSKLIVSIKKETSVCKNCQRFFNNTSRKNGLCNICSDTNRDTGSLMIIGHDVDIEAVEKSGAYNGFYFVLGGLIPILDKKPEARVRLSELKKIITEKSGHGLKEVVIALDVNPDGEYTSDYIKKFIKPFSEKNGFKITTLGRGLSTGTELEYSDPETIKNALRGRLEENI